MFPKTRLLDEGVPEKTLLRTIHLQCFLTISSLVSFPSTPPELRLHHTPFWRVPLFHIHCSHYVNKEGRSQSSIISMYATASQSWKYCRCSVILVAPGWQAKLSLLRCALHITTPSRFMVITALQRQEGQLLQMRNQWLTLVEWVPKATPADSSQKTWTQYP